MSNNPTFKPSEGKREEFRKYLEKNGVMDALTKVLVNLYEEPEKPEDALEFIRDRLAMQAGLETYSQMKARLDERDEKMEQLEQEMQALKTSLEPPPLEEEEGEVVPADDAQPGGTEEITTEEAAPPADEAQPNPESTDQQ